MISSLVQRSMAVAAAMIALTVSGFASQEPAGQTRQVSIVQEMSSVGLAFGQTLRYSWTNLTPPSIEERPLDFLRLSVRLLADDGSVLAQRSTEAISPGHSSLSISPAVNCSALVIRVMGASVSGWKSR